MSFDLQGILNLLLGIAGIDIASEISAFTDTFAYALLLWIYNIILSQGVV